MEHLHKCIKIAGFNYLLFADEDKKVIESDAFQGEDRLKNLVNIFEEIDF